MWTPEIKNGDMTGRVLQGSDCLIQWLEEAIENEGNAVYAVLGSGSEDAVLNALSDVVLSRMEYLLSCYKSNPGRFTDDQVFINFTLVPTAENEVTITLALLSGKQAELLWSGQK